MPTDSPTDTRTGDAAWSSSNHSKVRPGVGRSTVVEPRSVTDSRYRAVRGSPSIVVASVLGCGFVIVADHAQFSTAVSDLAADSYVGTALTLQTAIGFLLTLGSVQITPVIADSVGWQWAFAPLVVGPLVSTAAMLWLRRLPEVEQLAGGRG